MGASGIHGDTDAAMRVLICDQESEMLERVAREFEVDVATSKVTCIDLMRANPVDVVVASERLVDGSGLELLSHVATRWPDTLRVLAIEPARKRILGAKLAPFRLHATIRYPIDESELESKLLELQELIGAPDDEEPEEPPAPPPPLRPAPVPQRSAKPARGAPVAPATATSKSAKGFPGQGVTSRSYYTSGTSARVPSPASKPVRRKLGNYTPLGAPEDEQLRIVEREFDQTVAPLAARAIRAREEANRPRTPAEKVKSVADTLGQKLKRLLKKP